jgi:hypothetical protein
MKRVLLATATLCGVAILISMFSTPVAANNDNDDNDNDGNNSLIRIGFDIAPVPLDTRRLNKALVGLGSYIVNTGGCNDCHTNPSYEMGRDPFMGQPERINTAGYLGGGQVFGPFTSRNLTPRASDGRPAGLTLAEFTRTMRTGVDLKNRHPLISPLLQVMPWPVFGKKSDRDVKAVYEYLRAIPCVGSLSRCN